MSDVAPDGLASTVSVAEIRRQVEADKARAMEAIREAGHQMRHSPQYAFPTDITGNPSGNADHVSFNSERLRSLETVCRSPFYCRIDTTLTLNGEEEPCQILISKAREIGVVEGNGWRVVSWTSPLANLIEGKLPKDRVELSIRRASVCYLIHERTKYEVLLPQFENGEFRLIAGDAALGSEADLDALLEAPSSIEALPAREYTAKPSFGLSDIIVLRDEPQRAAMALPFGDSVVIEGPPGSGKTSIGIMRIAGLYDRQWEELGIDRITGQPLHDYNTMHVLVYNDEMVEYLRSLAQSIGVEHVQVRTTQDFFRRICQQTKLLTGTVRRDGTSLAIMKGRREALRAFYAGFKMNATRYWDNHCDDLRAALFDIAPDFLALADRLADWVGRIQNSTVTEDRITGQIGIADAISQAVEGIRRGQSPTRRALSVAGDLAPQGSRSRELSIEALQARLPDARELVADAIRGVCSRADSTRAMFGLAEYENLKRALAESGVPARAIEAADNQWRSQYEGTLPAYSELDLAMLAWLGARTLLSENQQRRPWIGGQLDQVTHLVVDEVQDLSPSHLTVLASQLAPNGTMTLVGDIHQNLNPYAGLRRWEDVPIPNVRRTAFGVNHRQTLQLGSFLKALHAGLYDEACLWEPSNRTKGPVPRIGVARSWKSIVRAISEEARHWRDTIEGSDGATVAVLYDGRIKPKRLTWLQKSVAAALSNDGTPVQVAMPGAGGEPLRRTNRVVIASVRQTKGLEFDAVVFIEPSPRWSKPTSEVDVRVRNGFYVAASRARAGLSVCMSNLPQCLDAIAADDLCETVKWEPEASE